MRSAAQMALPIPEPTPVMATKPRPADHVAPVEVDGCMELLKVRYSLNPVEGWAEIRGLSVYGGPGCRQMVAQRAWVDPATVESIYIQRYDDIAPRGLPPMPPISWGFGPARQIDRHARVMASFDLARPDEDYDRVRRLVRAKNMERNRRLAEESA